MKNKKNILIVIAITLLTIGSVATWWLFHEKEGSSSTREETNSNEAVNIVDYGPPEESDKIQPSDKDKVIEGEPQTPSTTSLRITQSIQQESTIYIRTIINGMSGGECALTLTRGADSIKKTAPINVQASYAVCQGFNVPLSEFSTNGTWNVNIIATSSNGSTAEASTKLEVTR